jgi:hypothetical protein
MFTAPAPPPAAAVAPPIAAATKEEMANQAMDKLPHLEKDTNEAVFEFFQYKKMYEDNKRRGRSRAGAAGAAKRPPPPKCVNCKRPVGNIFKITKNVYEARCGSKDKPCAFDISIQRRTRENWRDYNTESLRIMEEKKENIIKSKMDVVFGYATEAEGIKRVERDLKDYLEWKRVYEATGKDYIESVMPESRVQTIRRLRGEIEENIKDIQAIVARRSTENRPDYAQINAIYVQNLQPKVLELRAALWDVVEFDGGVLRQREISAENERMKIKDDVFVSRWAM